MNKNGDPLLNTKNKPIVATQTGGPVTIGDDGTVFQKGESIGKLQIVQFANPQQLQRVGAVLYQQAGNSGPPTPSSTLLQSGALESSNVSAVKEMMAVIQTNRSFEANERIIQAFRDADSKAIGLMRG